MERYSSYKDSNVSWIGMIPEHWGSKQLRSFLTLFTEKGHGEAQLLSVTREQGVIERDIEDKEENHNFVPEDLSGYKYIEKGDFAINKMKAWQGSYAVSDYCGIVSPAYFTCKLQGVNKQFFSRAIRSKAYIPFFTQYSKGIRVGQWDLNPNALKSIPFFLPPLSEQEKIVSYLENKTSKIDDYVADKEKEIELLQELKQKAIADAVTKGLNPNAKMKDSGISWIGEIPEHWEVKQLRSFLTLFTEKGHGDAQLLSVTHEQGVIERDKEDKEENHNFVPDDLSGYKYIEKGDFAINKMKAWQGSYAVSEYNGIVSPAYFTCKLKGVNKDFFSKAIRSKVYVPFFTQYSKGIRVGQWDLNPNALKSIPFFLPPSDEQQAIVAYIEEKCEKIDKLASELQSEIDYLKEYKQRLIADVVTGQVNVQNK